MFDTMKVAQRVREARNAQNMTQMALADEMGVSYQAVSNWERGNSMPDISKLEQLCDVLHITIYALLGTENKQAETVTRILSDAEPPAIEDVAEIAPILPPEKIRETVDRSRQSGDQASGKSINMKAIAEMAPFLDQETLGEILQNVEPDDYQSIGALAPFLSRKTLDDLVLRCDGDVDGELVDDLAPFLSQETLEKLVFHIEGGVNMEMVDHLAPFLSTATLDKLVEKLLEKGNTEDLSHLYPFLSKETMRKLVRKMMENGDFDSMRDAAVFV